MSRTVCRDGSLRASEVSLPLPCAKRNQGSDGFESFEHWFTASLMIFQASGLVAMGFRQKYGNQISDKVVSQCACCGTLFFSVFTGEALTPSESTGIYRPSGLASAGSYVEEMPPKGDAP